MKPSKFTGDHLKACTLESKGPLNLFPRNNTLEPHHFYPLPPASRVQLAMKFHATIESITLSGKSLGPRFIDPQPSQRSKKHGSCEIDRRGVACVPISRSSPPRSPFLSRILPSNVWSRRHGNSMRRGRNVAKDDQRKGGENHRLHPGPRRAAYWIVNMRIALRLHWWVRKYAVYGATGRKFVCLRVSTARRPGLCTKWDQSVYLHVAVSYLKFTGFDVSFNYDRHLECSISMLRKNQLLYLHLFLRAQLNHRAFSHAPN